MEQLKTINWNRLTSMLIATIAISIALVVLTVSSVYLLQHQAMSSSQLISEDVGHDLVVSSFASAERRIELLRLMGQSGLSLTIKNDSAENKSADNCLFQTSFPVSVDGLELAKINHCIAYENLATSISHSPSVITLLLAVVIFIFIALAVRFRFQKVLLEEKKNQEITDLYKQVAHDIRSPLSALNMVASTLKDTPEEKRLLIRNAIQRINDIANDLLAKGKQTAGLTELKSAGDLNINSKTKTEIILLPALVDSLVSGKRIQYRDKINVRIESDFKDSFGAFVMADGKDLMRLLSNLINNSVEAFKENNGEVVVAVRAHKESIQLTIKDNGVGIPPEVLTRMGEAGVTHGKDGTESGSGLGVYHAKKSIEAIGGQFIMSSQVGVGTQTEITLPRVAAPSWFLESIMLQSGMEVLCLDDDLTIHQIWKGRLDSLQATQQNIVVRNFTSAIEFKSFIKSQVNSQENKFYLIDYELLGQSTNGLSVIEELGIQDNVVLVTSRYEEPEIKERCEFLKIKLLPKSLAGFIPIEIKKPKESYDVILIDDDELIHLVWQTVARKKDKKLVGLYSFHEFLNRAGEFDFTSTIYIDSNLKNEVKGEVVSKEAFEMGFKNIYLCTGYEASHFPEMPHIKGIVGKDPVF
jgi:signal transduction histidine kinase